MIRSLLEAGIAPGGARFGLPGAVALGTIAVAATGDRAVGVLNEHGILPTRGLELAHGERRELDGALRAFALVVLRLGLRGADHERPGGNHHHPRTIGAVSEDVAGRAPRACGHRNRCRPYDGE